MPTHFKGTAEQVLALDTIIKLSRSVNALQSHLLPAIQKEFGITESQFAVLDVLHHLGPLSQGQICQKILRSGSNVTTVVDNLERDGLVRRDRDEADRRVQIVTLTDQGRQLIANAFPAHVAKVTELMAVLSPVEQNELSRLCRKLGKGVGV